MALISQSFSEPREGVPERRGPALTIIALGVIIAILYFGRAFFITAIAAVAIAFILEPFVGLLMRVRLPRSVASFVVCSAALAGLYVVGLGAYAQLAGLYDDLPIYGQRIGDIVDNVRTQIQETEDRTYRYFLTGKQRQQEEKRQKALAAAAAKKPAKRADPAPAPLVPEELSRADATPIHDYLYQRLSSLYHVVLMASFVPFLVYFMLSWRDHVNRSFLQLFHGEARLVAARSLAGIAELVRAFVVGNFLLGLMLAVFSSFAFWLIRLPYPMLVGPLSGFFSLVPYVGLPLALFPPLFAALGVNQVSVYLLVVGITATMHLLALNLLYPKVVGSRVHLNPLVVTFSLMFWGFLWDAAGLVLAIPLTAGVKAVCDNVKEWRGIGKFLGD